MTASEMNVDVLCRHGMLSTPDKMGQIAERISNLKTVRTVDNTGYDWNSEIVDSALKLAEEAAGRSKANKILLVGHSQGGLLCRVAAVALKGKMKKNTTPRHGITKRIQAWQCRNADRLEKIEEKKIGVVTIATPNCGAFTFGQTSVVAGLAARFFFKYLREVHGWYNLQDITSTSLFEGLQDWIVDVRHLSISGVAVNRYKASSQEALKYLLKASARVSIYFEKPNDGVVEDSSVDLRQSLFPPEIDLSINYRHVRAYRNSVEENHFSICNSEQVVNVIEDNLGWLF